jgi:chromosome segregation ATPase
VTTQRLAEIQRSFESAELDNVEYGISYGFQREVGELLAEVERLTEALETVIRENAAGYDNLKRRLEQLREERDRLADLLAKAQGAFCMVLDEAQGDCEPRRIALWCEDAIDVLSSLPDREDAKQQDQGGRQKPSVSGDRP